MASAYSRQLQKIAGEYREAGMPWPTSTRGIVVWAREKNMLAMREADVIGRLAEDMARALREEYYTDPQGRNVRAKHCVRKVVGGERITLWGDGRTEDREFMQTAMQQKRQGIVGDCRQLKNDVDSFNENRCPGDPIKIIFDFTRDVEEG